MNTQPKSELNIFKVLYDDQLKKLYRFRSNILPYHIQCQLEENTLNSIGGSNTDFVTFKKYFTIDKNLNNEVHLKPIEYLIFLLCIGISKFNPNLTS